MLISLKYRFLFVHIAKTGGTSIRAALTPLRWRDPYSLPMFLCSTLSHLTGHRLGVKLPRHAKAIAAKEILPADLYASLFKFTFVRNPWDLQVSSYHHVRRERPKLMQGIADFESFLRWKLNPERPYHYILDASVAPQLDHVVDLYGKLIVDYIGRYETLHEDYEDACRRIGIAPRPLPHRRRASERRDYRSYYTDATAALIAEHFRRDIEHFDYRFE